MLVELSINPLGRGTHISNDLAAVLKLIDDGGLRYLLTPFGTCIDGEWDDLKLLVKRRHDQARIMSPHVMTTARNEDEEGATDKLHKNIASVERAGGRELHALLKFGLRRPSEVFGSAAWKTAAAGPAKREVVLCPD